MRLTPVHRGVVAIVAIMLLAACVWVARTARHPTATIVESFPALPHHVQAEVFNGGAAAGAAAVGTSLLRHGGIDVVLSSNAPLELSGKERIQILVRRNDTTGVGRVIAVLGPADVVITPDPTRLVDLTVVLGKSFLSSKRPVSASR